MADPRRVSHVSPFLVKQLVQAQRLQKSGLNSLGMRIRFHVTPNAKEAHVVKVAEADFEVKVDEKAADGRANKRLLEILSEHLKVPKSRIVIVRGTKSRDKILEIAY
jgi:uncharacterized protein (TIGR00251 family)